MAKPFSIVGFVVKYSTAALGGVLVCVGAFLATLFVPYWLSGILWHVVPSLYTTAAGKLGTLGVALMVGIFAGIASFRATVRVYSRKKKGGPECSFLPIGDR